MGVIERLGERLGDWLGVKAAPLTTVGVERGDTAFMDIWRGQRSPSARTRARRSFSAGGWTSSSAV